MLSRLEALKKSFLFSFVDRESVQKIASISHLKTFRKNDCIFHEGDSALGFYIVVKGRIKIYKLSFAGAEHILHLVGEGASFAEAVVFGHLDRYPAFAQALSDTKVLFIPKKDFLSLMRSDFGLTLSILSSMSEKLKYFNILVEELSLKSADSRLAKYLLDLALKKKADFFNLDVKKVELAKKLGIVPETLSRTFARLRTKRIIRISRQLVTLLNKEALHSISSGEKA
ncbi:MAG: Crp/Fnr family transcriptional regulator [Candidatus Omnitrophica bacterium]|nr:Crp/Fnr family transcriptional regulator [Candidatus Omnitrophota bacterium]